MQSSICRIITEWHRADGLRNFLIMYLVYRLQAVVEGGTYPYKAYWLGEALSGLHSIIVRSVHTVFMCLLFI